MSLSHALLAAAFIFSASCSPTAPQPAPWHKLEYDATDNSRLLHHTYPAHLLEDHEVRRGSGVAQYVESGLRSGIGHDYQLRDSENFYWGYNGLPYVNLTTHAHLENTKILSLERHAYILKTAQCSPSAVQLSADSEHYQELQHAWNWIRFDDRLNLVTLQAEPKTWEEAFPSTRLQGGSRTLVPNPYHSQRGLNKRIKIEGKPKINLDHDLSKIGITLKDGKAGSLRIECNPCYSKGSLDFKFDIVPWLLPTPHLAGTFEVYGNGIGAAVAAKVIAATEYAGKDFEALPITFPIPYAGLAIPGIADLGLVLKFRIAGNVGKITGEVTATAGVKIDIDEKSVYIINFEHKEKNKNEGWKPHVTPILEVTADVSVSASVGPELAVEIAAHVLGAGGAVGLAIAGPTLDAKAHLEAKSGGGACNNPKARVGVGFDIGIKADLHAYESADLKVWKGGATQTFFGSSWPVFSTCIVPPGGSITSSSTPPTISATPTSAPFPIVNGTIPTQV